MPCGSSKLRGQLEPEKRLSGWSPVAVASVFVNRMMPSYFK